MERFEKILDMESGPWCLSLSSSLSRGWSSPATILSSSSSSTGELTFSHLHHHLLLVSLLPPVPVVIPLLSCPVHPLSPQLSVYVLMLNPWRERETDGTSQNLHLCLHYCPLLQVRCSCPSIRHDQVTPISCVQSLSHIFCSPFELNAFFYTQFCILQNSNQQILPKRFC